MPSRSHCHDRIYISPAGINAHSMPIHLHCANAMAHLPLFADTISPTLIQLAVNRWVLMAPTCACCGSSRCTHELGTQTGTPHSCPPLSTPHSCPLSNNRLIHCVRSCRWTTCSAPGRPVSSEWRQMGQPCSWAAAPELTAAVALPVAIGSLFSTGMLAAANR